MVFRIHRFRQAIGLIYIVLYLAILLSYVFILRNDRSWLVESKFAVTVSIWFILSLAVKVSMLTDRVVELLNVGATVAFLSIGFTYHPNPGNPSALQNFCYYLYLVGGPACDIFDFIYEGAAKRPTDRPMGS